jgi:branched-chain amino acid aminotransferase
MMVSVHESNLPYQDNPAWWNGVPCQVRDLRVSVLDLGLIHSDATYDVMAVRDHQPWAQQQHLDRFLNSCQAWRLPMPYTATELVEAMMSVHSRTGWDDSIIWTSVTRGVPRHGNPRDLKSPTPNVMIYAKPWQKFNGTNQATVIESRESTRVPDHSINQNNKNFAWNDLTLAQWEALDHGYDTAAVFGTDGYLSEGPGFNIAVVKHGKVLAPGKNRLPGITMTKVREACLQQGIEFEWADLTRHQVNDCDDMFLTTTVGNIVTVTNYNGRSLEGSPEQDLVVDYFENARKETS